MARDIKIKVTADAKGAQQDLEALAESSEDAQKAIDQLDGTKVGIDTGDAERDIDGLMSKVDRLVGAGAGDSAQILLATNAADISHEIADLIVQLDEADASDVTIDAQVEHIAQLQGDLDQVTAKIKEVNATPVAPDTTKGQQGMDDLSKSADSSGSVMANMIGNTTQDMGELAGITGSAGVAIGQMGEYMADALLAGDSLSATLKNFGAVAGPVAGLAIATTIIGEFSKKAEEARKAMEELRKTQESLKAGDTEQAIQGLVDQYGDLILGLDQAGVSLEDFMAALDAGTADQYTAAIEGMTASGQANAATWSVITGELDAMQSNWTRNEAAIGRNDEATQALAESMGLVVTSTGEMVSGQEAAAAASDLVTEALNANAEAAQNALDAFTAYADAQRAAADSSFAVRDATDDFLDSVEGLDTKLAEIAESGASAESIQRDQQRALDDSTRSAIALADAHVQLAEDEAAAAGGALTATGRIDAQNSAMVSAAATAAGPLRSSIVDYIAEVNNIPPEKASEILALIDQGKLDEANAKLADASRTRDAAVRADATNVGPTDAELNHVARTRTATIVAQAVIGTAQAALAGLGKSAAVSGSAAGTRSGVVVNISAPGGVYGDAGINQLADAVTSSLATRLGAGLR